MQEDRGLWIWYVMMAIYFVIAILVVTGRV